MKLRRSSSSTFADRFIMDDHVQCAYRDCELILPISKMEMVGSIDGFPQHVCPGCADKMENITGFCSLSCQLGHGCDEFC